MWFPKNIVKQRASGLVNMATLADALPEPRFGLHMPYAVNYVRAWFIGGTGAATMSLYQKFLDASGTFFDRLIREFPDAGIGTAKHPFIDFRASADEVYRHWTFAPEIRIVPVWTNPDPANMRWSIEVGLEPQTI